MRLGILLEQLLAPVPGGTARYSAELGTALARTAGPDDRVAGFTAWHRSLGAAQLSGVGGPRRLALPAQPLALAWQRGFGPAPRGADVVHAPTLLVPPARSAAMVVTIHDAIPWTHPETLTPRGARWHRTMAERATREAAAIVVPTDAVGAQLLRVLPELAKQSVHVLGNGVSPIFRERPDEDARTVTRLGLPERFLLFVGTVEPRKGLDVLIEALARSQLPPVVVVGPAGWGDVDIDLLAREHGLSSDRVLAIGRQHDSELAALMRTAVCLVAPSRAEGFGLPVAEAMAAGTAVVCSNDPAMAEVAGDAAVLVPVGDADALRAALERVVGDGALRAELAASGLDRSRAFDWDAVALQAWSLYRSLLR